VRLRLRGINTVTRKRADGSSVVYRYHRKTGVQIKGLPGTPEFLESYAAAEKSMRDRGGDTIFAWIRKFEAKKFDGYEETTRNEYVRKFKIIERKWGAVPVTLTMQPGFRRDVIEWRDEIAKRAKREADNLVSALACVLDCARDGGKIGANPLSNIERVYHADRSDKIWLPEHVDAFTKAAPTEMCQALMLAMHTGQRQGDLRRLPWSAYDGERITLRQNKTKVEVSIRCTAALKRMLDGMALEKKGPLILTTPTGRAWQKRYFAECWQEASEAAGITDLHFHDLRGTAVTMLAEAGCTVPEIAAVTGHSLAHAQRILDAYMARTRALADAAILKLERHAKRLQKRS
jgi:integrase